jgi:hypothetical protein
MNLRRVATVIALALLCDKAIGEETAVKNYFVLPVKTDFQRFQLFSSATAYAQVYSSAIAHDGVVDASAFDMAKFRKELAALGGGDNDALMLYFRYTGTDRDAPEAQLLQAAVKTGNRKW